MRPLLIFALVATAILMSACEWISPSVNTSKENELEGKWKVDSITAGKDSSNLFFFVIALGSIGSDSNQPADLFMEFRKDSVIVSGQSVGSDTSLYKHNPSAKSLHILNEDTADSMTYRIPGPRAMSIIYNDSSVIHLSKQ